MPQIKFHAVGPHEGKTVSLDRFDFVDGVYTFTGTEQDYLAVAHTLRTQYQAYPAHEFEEAKKAYDDAQAEAALAEPEPTPASIEVTLKQRITARRFIDEGLDPEQVYGPGEAANQLKAAIAHLRAEDDEGNDVLNADELAQLQAKQDEEDRLKREAEEKAKKEAEEQAEKDRLEKEAADKAAAEAAEKAKAEQEAKEKADKEAADKAAADALLQQNGGQQPPVDPEKPEGEQHQDGGEQQSQDNGGGEQQPEGAKIETVADALQALDPANDEHWTARGVPSIEAMVKLLGRPVTRAEVEEVAPDYTRSVAKAAKAAS
ncbi:hypothetical protein RCRUDOLPH_16 [Rhodobacter phage RcRudolph]|nr:hypothetical protein RCRUDOLPH_16 [Rhodobacter phage RcRudolph]